MKLRSGIAGIGIALAAVSLWAFGLNYNASKSNTGNIVVYPESVTGAQATALLAEVDKGKTAPTEVTIKANLSKNGVKQGVVKQIVIENTAGKTTVLLLDDPADLTKARAAMANTSTSRSNQQHN